MRAQAVVLLLLMGSSALSIGSPVEVSDGLRPVSQRAQANGTAQAGAARDATNLTAGAGRRSPAGAGVNRSAGAFLGIDHYLADRLMSVSGDATTH